MVRAILPGECGWGAPARVYLATLLTMTIDYELSPSSSLHLCLGAQAKTLVGMCAGIPCAVSHPNIVLKAMNSMLQSCPFLAPV